MSGGFDFEFFTCSKCNHAYATQYERDKHEARCLNIIFLDEEEVVEQPKPYPSYQELLKKASEKDASIYTKYVGRRHIYEPNNMIEVWGKSHRKAKNGH